MGDVLPNESSEDGPFVLHMDVMKFPSPDEGDATRFTVYGAGLANELRNRYGDGPAYIDLRPDDEFERLKIAAGVPTEEFALGAIHPEDPLYKGVFPVDGGLMVVTRSSHEKRAVGQSDFYFTHEGAAFARTYMLTQRRAWERTPHLYDAHWIHGHPMEVYDEFEEPVDVYQDHPFHPVATGVARTVDAWARKFAVPDGVLQTTLAMSDQELTRERLHRGTLSIHRVEATIGEARSIVHQVAREDWVPAMRVPEVLAMLDDLNDQVLARTSEMAYKRGEQ